MEAIFDYEEVYNSDVAWEALKAASQEPSEEEVTSNTQWSQLFMMIPISPQRLPFGETGMM